MEYAKSLIKNPQLDSPDGTEESWTFVNTEESDAEIVRKNSVKDDESELSKTTGASTPT